MIKILHSADWHMDSPIQGRTTEQTALLRQSLLRLPQLITAAAVTQGCDLMVLSGDLFDGPATPESVAALRSALEEFGRPVFIAPGNHDPLNAASVWHSQIWPKNVHIFSPALECVEMPHYRVYGAAFTTAESHSLLADFQIQPASKPAIGVFHGDPTQANSPYSPITAEQVSNSGLDYLALGHIHKGGSFRTGKTLCAWPGCPMGRGFDELDEKGVLIVTLDDSGAQSQFLPLHTPRFYDWECSGEPAEALGRLLPAVGNYDFYRITFTGECEPPNLEALQMQFSHFPNLILRDRTVPPLNVWETADRDSLEGVYFSLLRNQLEENRENAELAARISRQILEGLEVELP